MKKKVPWLTKNEWIYFFYLYEQDFIKFKKEYSERKNIVINRKHLYYFRIKYKEYIMNNQKIKKPKSIDNSRNNGFKCILCPPLYLNTLTIYIYVKINSLCFK